MRNFRVAFLARFRDVLVLAPAAIVASVLLGCAPNVSERDITGVELASVLDATRAASPDLLVDARAPSRFEAGHLPGAIRLGIAEINTEGRRRPDLLQPRRLVVYGQNPGDTLASGLTLRLLEAGYDNAVLFRGGVDAWLEAGYELTRPAPADAPASR